ncbi:acyl-CoA dehydrogenase family protein [Fictibacillus phosphorivorans]|uniref:acyl-CoA dehydrogenase family protein n=1 Tax=Fictibacillus phosphorivorans TaxID=1221500 RepID=UPI00203B2EE2|nr:acyl-CoA dehydrogenase family protein [Fictibacillus phosphorivorans]MCM3719552.1 acyl-CoA/acyl-ACP dehydrogenase [Fictibacillus phosphorivorans]MCM3777243.1 acyl-CoA/acyl-ACP dehydrogenase [Fictibacillus phosphorivorans]
MVKAVAVAETKQHTDQTNIEKILKQAEELKEIFSTRADAIDSEGVFPYKNFADLKNANFLSLTIPKEYGGKGLNLLEYLQVQEIIAQGDAPTALSLGWHLGVLLEAAENRHWQGSTFEKVSTNIVRNKALLNLAQTERATGSPSRGGTPGTTAKKVKDGWRLNGVKAFTSMAEALDYSIITADLDYTGTKGFILVDHNLEGISIKETWDSISMRGTKSDDLVLNDVFVKEEDLLFVEDGKSFTARGWYLQVPAVYIGIAAAAKDYAIKFASDYSPSTLPGPIKDVPEVRRKIGKIELELFNARQVLYSVARKWVEQPEQRINMGKELAAVKHIATNSANKVVDLAMKIVGARSLSASNPLQRHFRDVRAGLHNPPTDDAIVYNLADSVLGKS